MVHHIINELALISDLDVQSLPVFGQDPLGGSGRVGGVFTRDLSLAEMCSMVVDVLQLSRVVSISMNVL